MKKRGYIRRKLKPHGYSWGLKRSRLRAKPDKKLAEWSRQVRERDGNVCQWPGGCQTGDLRIDSHHIAKRSQRPDLRLELSNGISLCRTHHDWTDDNHDAAVAMGLLNTESRELANKLFAEAA